MRSWSIVGLRSQSEVLVCLRSWWSLVLACLSLGFVFGLWSVFGIGLCSLVCIWHWSLLFGLYLASVFGLWSVLVSVLGLRKNVYHCTQCTSVQKERNTIPFGERKSLYPRGSESIEREVVVTVICDQEVVVRS